MSTINSHSFIQTTIYTRLFMIINNLHVSNKYGQYPYYPNDRHVWDLCKKEVMFKIIEHKAKYCFTQQVVQVFWLMGLAMHIGDWFQTRPG